MILASLLGGWAMVGWALEGKLWEVAQKNKQFSVKHLVIQQGDVVNFPNQDEFYHNVFSLSPTKTFDLGSYKKGSTARVTFENKGTVLVQCAIHPQMEMTIEVR
ncbi:MAG: methylamine utilization protein [Candidatus Lambdaproteobacteria bacterium RIFOXYD1_FULL_56_27]|uniref:Methylamine utilization protein n=1 Tax=Candidatus Lambdaproteobacteria bacterium RIFOXYD2_FULL_56_26 TaxID=1817773 RepID=A0A1F6GPM1_9PROT|nr:MAG: methylamine utilization protein [Candidatus Lambdaproteobacteria bacterium RIFOXYD2_FULL_56_26]OGH03827.1 MAG: methylamine utilization protein [Candidatus Lambdaproteobacteria bacterium RIFOXYC1_FULL_56_13]OGH06234.1 MAG: methylamine utilization protein [Candidatus Lambdaproteobacteria bacterium RIFOXYD1_FULL_56_27]